jgi:hypothetical protein
LGEYDYSDERLEDSVGLLPATWLTAQEEMLTKALNSYRISPKAETAHAPKDAGELSPASGSFRPFP